MKNYLLFRLYGALASWGDIAVGDIRPSYRYPSKSAVIGLIAAAMGIKRDEQDKQSELAKMLFAVRVDAMGVPLDDYHTIQAPSEQTIKSDRAKDYWTRLDEIEAIKLRVVESQSSAEAGAIQSRRTYHCDAVYTVCLSEDENNNVNWQTLEINALEDIVPFLMSPRFVLYLGRKACPLGLPLEPQIKQAENCRTAFQAANFKFADELKTILSATTIRQFYSQEVTENSKMKLMRRDQPVNRAAWQFSERDEYYFSE
jgi:CRISPR system Cascade subunit CasD